MKVIVIGGGVIGAAAAYHLARSGVDVMVLDAGGGATSASFGWINASFSLNSDHFRLRCAGMQAYASLAEGLDVPLRHCGCLSWEYDGDTLHNTARRLRDQGYRVEILDRNGVAKHAPRLRNVPAETLYFPTEAVTEPSALVAALLADIPVVSGVRVTGFMTRGDRITGVCTQAGDIAADEVLVAAGTGTQDLLAQVDVSLPLVPRPAYVMQTKPAPIMLRQVLATKAGEIRQRSDGVFVMPTSVTHQDDRSAVLALTGPQAADDALARLCRVLGTRDLDWAQVTRANRPMPADALPAVGRVRSGLTVAVMHSGITLGAVMGTCLAQEITTGPSNHTNDLLASFRPDRFQ